MDSLIYLLERFVIYEHEFDKHLGIIFQSRCVRNPPNILTQNPWNLLQENYSKLKYLDELINFYNIPNIITFAHCLGVVLLHFDTLNKFYIEELNCSQQEYILLQNSFTEKDQYKKLKMIVYTYRSLIDFSETKENQNENQNFISKKRKCDF